MLTKNDIRDSIIHEYKVIKQLVSKLPEGSEGYRLSEGQRSTIELLRYLALLGPGMVHAANDNGFDWLGENAAAVDHLTLGDVPAHLDGAMAELSTLFDAMSDEDFTSREVSVEGMGDWTIQTWLLNTVCKFMPAYKLMLFHHAKGAGNGELGTWDAWLDNGEVPAPAAG